MRALLTVSLLWLLGSASAADPDAVAKLIAQLGSPDYRAREAASKELDALGGPALPAIRKAAASSPDAETARRAAELAAKIAKRMDNDQLLTPTLVELNFENAPLKHVLDALEKQSGGRLVLGEPEAKVTVKTSGKVPFWDAVAKVCDATGFEMVPTAVVMPAASDPRTREALMMAERQAALAAAMAQQVQALKARQAAAVGNRGGGDGQKAEELIAQLRQQQARMEQAMAQLAEMQARRAALDRATGAAAYAPGPATLSLQPRSDRPHPSCVSGAVRVEAVPFPAAALEGVPRDTVPVVLHAGAEPRLKWQRVESVRVTRATDDAGRELAAAADDLPFPTRVFPVPGAAIVGGNFDRLGRRPTQAFMPAATQALVRLKATGDVKSLKSLEGVLRGVIRTGPEELAAVAGLDRKPVASALGANGLALSVSLTERPEGEAYDFEATLRYDPTEVQVAGLPDVEEQFGRRGGRAVVIRAQAPVIVAGGRINRDTADGPRVRTAFGLTLTDADGKPFDLTVVSSTRIFTRTITGEVIDRIKLLARPSEEDQGAPAKASCTGTRAKVIEVPFKLTDVPVAAGTAETPAEPTKPAGK
jgi:hypothetical protein